MAYKGFYLGATPAEAFIRNPLHPVAVIGLAGLARSGKDTAATAFREVCPRAGITRFATPLKTMLTAFLRHVGASDEEIVQRLEGDLKEDHCEYLDTTPRFAMQTLGTEWGRDTIDPDIWVNATRRHILSDRYAGKVVLIPDVRFDNEVAAIRGMTQLGIKNLIIHVEREGQEAAPGHSSENSLTYEGFDHRFVNDGTWRFPYQIAMFAAGFCRERNIPFAEDFFHVPTSR